MQMSSQSNTPCSPSEEIFSSSEDQYRATLDAMRDAIHVVDAKLIILLMNERFRTWCQELGFEIGNPIGRNIFEVFPHLPERVRQEYACVFESAQILTTVEVTQANGHEIATETRKIPVCDASGHVTRLITIVRDITEPERVRKENEAAKERIRLLFETIPHALYECDRDGTITITNQAYSQITGYAKDELVGMSIQQLMAPGPQKDEIAVYLRHLTEEQPEPTPYLTKNLKKDGQTIDVEVHWNYRRDDQDQVVGFVCILSDVTQRKQAERTLQESEERFRVLSEATFEGVAFGDRGILIDANKAFLEIYGYCYEEAIGKPVMDFVLSQDQDLVLQKIRSGYGGVYEHKGRHKDGHVIDLEVHGRNVVYQGRDVRMTAVRDVTQRKRVDAKLLEYQRHLKSLATQLTLTEEHEKRLVAEQLHDDVGQCLAFCKLKLQVAQNSVSDPTIANELKDICEMLTLSMDHIKNVTYDLSSPVLKELGFEKAVGAWLKDEIEPQHCIETRLVVDGQTQPTDENLKALLFRSTRELVVNSVKHANPNRIHVHINRRDDAISVRVEDDGKGFDPETIENHSSKGFGLFSIRERLDYLGGSLDLVSASGQGCTATLEIPVN